MERRVDKALLRCKRLSVQLISVQRATEAIALFNERVVLIAVLELWWELVLQRLVGNSNVPAVDVNEPTKVSEDDAARNRNQLLEVARSLASRMERTEQTSLPEG